MPKFPVMATFTFNNGDYAGTITSHGTPLPGALEDILGELDPVTVLEPTDARLEHLVPGSKIEIGGPEADYTVLGPSFLFSPDVINPEMVMIRVRDWGDAFHRSETLSIHFREIISINDEPVTWADTQSAEMDRRYTDARKRWNEAR